MTPPPKPLRHSLFANSFAMTPAGVGKFSPGDTKTTLIRLFTRLNSPDLLANQARGAEGKLVQYLSRPNFSDRIFQVALVRKTKITELGKTSPTPLAA